MKGSEDDASVEDTSNFVSSVCKFLIFSSSHLMDGILPTRTVKDLYMNTFRIVTHMSHLRVGLSLSTCSLLLPTPSTLLLHAPNPGWKNNSQILLAANSLGTISIMQLE